MFSATKKGRIELGKAIREVQASARRLDDKSLDDDTKFRICWNLAWVYLRDLEAFRIPD
jgi:hypothetical protein